MSPRFNPRRFVRRVQPPTVVRVAVWSLVGLAGVSLVLQASMWIQDLPRYASVGVAALSLLWWSTAVAINVLLPLAALGGRNWARIVLLLLCVPSLVLLVVDVSTGVMGRSPSDYVFIFLSDIAAALLLLPPSNRYFREVAAERARYEAALVPIRGL